METGIWTSSGHESAGEAARELLPTLSVKVFLLHGIEVMLESCSRTQKTTVEFHMHISAKRS
jgi:recombinational DNA repair protein (RecF pathway)